MCSPTDHPPATTNIKRNRPHPPVSNTKGRRRPSPLVSSDESSNSSSSGSENECHASPRQQRPRRRQRCRGNAGKTNCNPPKPSHNNKATVDLPPEANICALDCEMVGTGEDGHTSTVARVTLVDWMGQTLLDEYIKPKEEVTDYRTFVSGITEKDISSSDAITLEECQVKVQEILQEHKILVGHALKNDLRALGISHPWYLTRDTAKYEPFMQVRFDDGVLWPRKLKDLCHEKLHKDIQVPGQPHSPYEDAKAALELYRAVRPKWEKVMQYKLQKTNEILQAQHQPLIVACQ